MQLLAAALGLGLIFGLGAKEVRRFEHVAAEDIRSRIQGESADVSVKTQLNGVIGGPLGDLKQVTIRAAHFSTDQIPLFTEPARSKRGRVRDLRILLEDFRIAGLRIEHLEAAIPDCRFDYALAVGKKQIRLSKSGVGTGNVRVLQKDLEEFILRKFHEIKRVSVTLENDLAYVEGYGEFIVVQTDFRVVAKLVAVDGVKLILSDARVYFGNALADEAAKKVVLDTITPVVDLDKDLGLFGAIKVKELKLHGGTLEAWGETRIPERPGEAKVEGRRSKGLAGQAILVFSFAFRPSSFDLRPSKSILSNPCRRSTGRT